MMGAQPYLISIHAPRVGSDQRVFEHLLGGVAISIHAPRVGSDIMPSAAIHWPRIFLSTLPAWGATQRHAVQRVRAVPISIHAPRVGSDGVRQHHPVAAGGFLSTLPAWGATLVQQRFPPAILNFYPRSPRGERPSAGD